MTDHDLPVAANYVNWPGRTVKQAREEADLRQAIGAFICRSSATLAGQSAEQIHAQVRQFVDAEKAAGKITLTPLAPATLGQKIANLFDLVVGGMVAVVLLFLVGLLLIFRIRSLEKTDPVFAPRPEPEQARELAVLEDWEFTNQYSAMGSLKPGLARRWAEIWILWVIGWAGRHFYTRGRLARVRTIHFARWVFLDGKKRVLFCSNYDGSLDSYNDDFINKVSIGLNLSFSGGIGYPTTQWMVSDGAKDEQKFKYYLRRHQMPSQVWYNAHPSVTAIEMERNGLIREGLDAAVLSGEDARKWVQLL